MAFKTLHFLIHRHCEEHSDVAIHISGGARRQMDCFAFGSQWQWGWLAMTVGMARNDSGRLAMTPVLVIARSKATWQTTHPLSLRGAKRRGNPHQPRHCEKQSDVAIYIQVVQDLRWIASPSARNDSGGGSQWPQFLSLRGAKRRGNQPQPRHCEKQSDVAIHIQVVQDERWIASPSARNDSVGGLQWTLFLSLRGAKRRGKLYQSRHCEEQSDVAIHISCGARRQMDCFAFGSQWQWAARNDSNLCHCEECSDVAINPNPVIARSKATWQSIFR